MSFAIADVELGSRSVYTPGASTLMLLTQGARYVTKCCSNFPSCTFLNGHVNPIVDAGVCGYDALDVGCSVSPDKDSSANI